MSTEHKNPSGTSEHDRKNEGGRESGRVHDPNQAQQASKNQGLSDSRMEDKKQQQHVSGQHQQQQHSSGQHQQSSSGQHQQSGSGSHQGSSSQQGSQGSRPPGSASEEQHQKDRDKRSA